MESSDSFWRLTNKVVMVYQILTFEIQSLIASLKFHMHDCFLKTFPKEPATSHNPYQGREPPASPGRPPNRTSMNKRRNKGPQAELAYVPSTRRPLAALKLPPSDCMRTRPRLMHGVLTQSWDKKLNSAE